MGGFSQHDRQLAKRLQHGRCFVCHRELGDHFEVHAVIPGLHYNVHNAIALCHSCHARGLTYGKGTRGLLNFYLGKNR